MKSRTHDFHTDFKITKSITLDLFLIFKSIEIHQPITPLNIKYLFQNKKIILIIFSFRTKTHRIL